MQNGKWKENAMKFVQQRDQADVRFSDAAKYIKHQPSSNLWHL
jgi:hypothetical protein